MRRRTHPVLAGLLGAASAAVTAASITGRGISRGPERWRRVNHAGRPVTLLQGPAVSAGALAGIVIRAAVDGRARTARAGVAQAVAIGGSALVGGYDDLLGSTQAKGFRGHLGALRRGVVTSGMIKIAGVGLSSLTAAVISSGGSLRPHSTGRRGADVIINTTLIAATANLTNLLDLRPGRASKLIIALGLPAGALPVVGAAAGALPDDLAGRSMLGDCGANALGAGVAAAATRLPIGVRLVALAGVVGLNLASERVSFTAYIAEHPILDAVDHWGRPATGGTSSGPGVG